EQWRLVEGGAGENKFARCSDELLFAGLIARITVRAVHPLAFKVFDADRSILLVEQDLGREGVELEGEITGKSLLDVQQKLPGAIAAALVRGQRRQANTDRVGPKQTPIVGLEQA